MKKNFTFRRVFNLGQFVGQYNTVEFIENLEDVPEEMYLDEDIYKTIYSFLQASVQEQYYFYIVNALNLEDTDAYKKLYNTYKDIRIKCQKKLMKLDDYSIEGEKENECME